MSIIEIILAVIELLLIVALVLIMMLLVVLISEYIRSRNTNQKREGDQENGSMQTVHSVRED